MLKVKLILLFLFFITGVVYAQDLGLKHFTKDDGLPSNTVFSLYSDSKGYMWMGTDKGVVRYNGLDFKIFTTKDGLPDNEIFSFTEDYEGRLWIANFKGVLCYYKDNVFHTATNTPWLKLKQQSSNNYFDQFKLQKDGSIITESVDAKRLLVIKNRTIMEVPLSKINQQLNVIDLRSILPRKIDENHFQLYFNHKSFIIDSSGNILKIQYYKDTSLHYSINGGKKDYLGTPYGLFTINEKWVAKLPQDGPITLPFARYIRSQDDKNVFIASTHGLYYNQSRLLPAVNITSINYDATGNLWISMADNGIFCLSRYFNNSYSYKLQSNAKIIASGINGNDIHLLNEDGDLYTMSDTLSLLNISAPSNTVKPKTLIKSNTIINLKGDVFSFQKAAIYYKRASDKKYKIISNNIETSSEILPTAKSIYYIDSAYYITTMCNIFFITEADLLKQNTITLNDVTWLHSNTIQDRIYSSSLNKSDSSLWFSMADKMCHIKNKTIIQEKALQNYTFRYFVFF